MIYTSCKLLVPIQYANGLHETQTNWGTGTSVRSCYDQSLLTFGSFASSAAVITTKIDVAATQCFVRTTWRRISGTGSIIIKRDATTLTIDSYNADVGSSTYWTVATGFYRNLSYTGSKHQSCLFNLTNSTADNVYSLATSGVVFPTPNFYSIIFSKTFSVPLWDKGSNMSMSFSQPIARSPQDNVFSSWIRARNFQAEVKKQVKWTGLTASQFSVFESAFNSFGGSIAQPFVLARLTDSGSNPNYDAQFHNVIINGEPEYRKTRTGDTPLYDLSLNLIEMNSAY